MGQQSITLDDVLCACLSLGNTTRHHTIDERLLVGSNLAYTRHKILLNARLIFLKLRIILKLFGFVMSSSRTATAGRNCQRDTKNWREPESSKHHAPFERLIRISLYAKICNVKAQELLHQHEHQSMPRQLISGFGNMVMDTSLAD
jgi:hypothetical protein